MSNAVDYGEIMKVLVNDSELKTLMLISTLDQSNYGLLVDKYFLQTYVSDKFTNDGICRILIRNGIQQEISNNDYVKWNSVIFEIFVPFSKDLVDGFQTRINKICDRLIKIFNRTYINYNKLVYCDNYEIPSLSANFKRYNCKFEYKKIIR